MCFTNSFHSAFKNRYFNSSCLLRLKMNSTTIYDADNRIWSGPQSEAEISKNQNFGDFILNKLAENDAQRILQVRLYIYDFMFDWSLYISLTSGLDWWWYWWIIDNRWNPFKNTSVCWKFDQTRKWSRKTNCYNCSQSSQFNTFIVCCTLCWFTNYTDRCCMRKRYSFKCAIFKTVNNLFWTDNPLKVLLSTCNHWINFEQNACDLCKNILSSNCLLFQTNKSNLLWVHSMECSCTHTHILYEKKKNYFKISGDAMNQFNNF